MPHSPTDYVGWCLDVPDQYRADVILRELGEFEQDGEFPVPGDRSACPTITPAGRRPGAPRPPRMVADNDLAMGRLVEGLSHSRFWKEMAIFAIEDDPQDGWDHVSGYRTTAYVASPYARRGAVVSTQYNTVCVLRTIEQILGLEPMNQFDAAAPPMRDCFTDTPDFTPFDGVPNTVPLDQMNPVAPRDRRSPAAGRRPGLGHDELRRSRPRAGGRPEPHPLARDARARALPGLGRRRR